MAEFKAKMHQIQNRLGLRPDPTGGAYSVPPDPLAGFKGPTSKGGGGEGREGEGWGKGGEGGIAPWTLGGIDAPEKTSCYWTEE